MEYSLEVKDEPKLSLKGLSENLRKQIGYRLHLLQQDFSGDIFELVEEDYSLCHWTKKGHLSMKTEVAKQPRGPIEPVNLDQQIARAKSVLRELRDTLEDLDDRRELARAKKRNGVKPGTGWETVKKELGLNF